MSCVIDVDITNSYLTYTVQVLTAGCGCGASFTAICMDTSYSCAAIIDHVYNGSSYGFPLQR